MSQLILYLGGKENSSWSLRAWLMLTNAGVDFEAKFITLDQADTKERISKISPSGMLPVLVHDNATLWDSLAIGEYLAETFPSARLWPQQRMMRAKARSISCEMHSGFHALRKHLPFNLKPQKIQLPLSADVQADIDRVLQIWEECRLENEYGDFLFGDFTIADAMYAPVVSRFLAYGIETTPLAKQYMDTIMKWPAMKMWYDDI